MGWGMKRAVVAGLMMALLSSSAISAPAYDLVIRNTTIATASDVVKGDIGVLGGRVVALGERLDKGRKEIDASGLIAVPGGIDAHVHFDQDTADGSVFCDDFESGSRAGCAPYAPAS